MPFIHPIEARQHGICFGIDRGGTFTDVYATIPAGVWCQPSADLIGNASILQSHDIVQVSLKLLSEDPSNYADAPAEGIRRVLSMARGRRIPSNERIDTSGVDFARMGTTVATNALLQRKGVRFALLVTRGFRDLLEIGDQKRPDLFDLSIANKPAPLYRPEDVLEVDERVTPDGYAFDPDPSVAIAEAGRVVSGVDGQGVRVLQELDEGVLRMELVKLYDKGIRSLAVVFLHSSNFPGGSSTWQIELTDRSRTNGQEACARDRLHASVLVIQPVCNSESGTSWSFGGHGRICLSNPHPIYRIFLISLPERHRWGQM